nr:MAG TPA: hypothetical protein [Caudoviricetes sp.]
MLFSTQNFILYLDKSTHLSYNSLINKTIIAKRVKNDEKQDAKQKDKTRGVR